jgi:hypothetical protein
MGIYQLEVRTDGKLRARGGKGWRLELQKTRHRENIQIHRAAPSMYIEGCILPVHFNSFQGSAIHKGDEVIRTRSITIMDKIQARWSVLLNSGTVSGRLTLAIAEILPSALLTDRSHVNV